MTFSLLQAEAKLLRENKKAAEARSYWHQKRVQEQQVKIIISMYVLMC